MYRVVKKTTQKTAYKCLDCKHCKRIDARVEPWGCYVECTAENKCFMKSFNARDYYCIQYKGFNDMDNLEKEKVRNAIQEDYSKKAYKEYVRNYYSKKEAKSMIEKRRGV